MKLNIKENNGLFADPDMIKVDDWYYIYPTTDGFWHWSGTEFYVYRSKDKQNWENMGKILDLTKDVPWSVGSAWAPCTLVKNGKYYFYFCGKNREGVSAIGVAVAENPTGPFVAEPEPIVTVDMVKKQGLNICQAIDPSVYTEDEKSYLLFGNGNGLICELGEDCLSLKEDTMKEIEGLYDFRESVIVTKYQEQYHFTWSCDDTGSENYHVNYGVSDSLFGPVTYLYPILEKDATQDILGTGHHCILKDGEKYLIGYHRFATPLERVSEGKGFHRELCMDELEFGKDGKINKVKVTF